MAWVSTGVLGSGEGWSKGRSWQLSIASLHLNIQMNIGETPE
jgi:hypothetical protein